MGTLRSSQNTYVSGQSIPIYAYEIKDKYINKPYVKYDSITEASRDQGVARSSRGELLLCLEILMYHLEENCISHSQL